MAGYYGGWLDDILMRVVDILFAFPAFILAMVITGVLGDTVENVIIAITIAYAPYFIRLTRSEMLSIRTYQYADARAIARIAPAWKTVTFINAARSIQDRRKERGLLPQYRFY